MVIGPHEANIYNKFSPQIVNLICLIDDYLIRNYNNDFSIEIKNIKIPKRDLETIQRLYKGQGWRKIFISENTGNLIFEK